MIKLEKSQGGVRLKDPENLVPTVFRCYNCNCIVRKLEDTHSYVIMTVSKDVIEGKIPPCSFCSKLIKAQGINY